jgi:hypothetical protein
MTVVRHLQKIQRKHNKHKPHLQQKQIQSLLLPNAQPLMQYFLNKQLAKN